MADDLTVVKSEPVPELSVVKSEMLPAAAPSMLDRLKSGAETFVNTMPVVGDIHQAAGAVQDWAAKKIAPENPTMASPAATFGYGALRDTAGLVHGATSPAGLAATVGTVALPEAAALALIAHGVYSGVKGWGDLKNPDVLQNELNAGAEVAGGAALGGAAIKAGGGPRHASSTRCGERCSASSHR